MVGSDEGLEHDHPVRVLCPLNQEVGQGRDGHIRLVRAVQQIYKLTRMTISTRSEVQKMGGGVIAGCSMVHCYTEATL